MNVKKPIRTAVFSERDEVFIQKLAGDIGCHYSRANDRTYNLNKFDSNIQGEKGVFAWVHKEDHDCFWIATRKSWVEEAKARAMAGKKSSGINCFPKDNQHSEDSVCLNIKDDYQKAVRVLSFINLAR